MSLESATYVKQLVSSNPDGSDPKGQGDDHLRLIKTTLLNTFPNLDAAVTVTPAEINLLAGGTNLFKAGMIILWSGSFATVPTGWKLCDGTAGTPNLMDRFIVGAGNSYAVGSTGGSLNHTHTVSIGGTALTVAQIPPHTHDIYANDLLGAGGGSNPDAILNGATYVGTTTATGSGATHTHSASATVIDHRPPYFALAYIMKT